MIDPLPLPLARRDLDRDLGIPSVGTEADFPRPRRSLSFPSPPTSNEHSGFNGMGASSTTERGGTPGGSDTLMEGYGKEKDGDENGVVGSVVSPTATATSTSTTIGESGVQGGSQVGMSRGARATINGKRTLSRDEDGSPGGEQVSEIIQNGGRKYANASNGAQHLVQGERFPTAGSEENRNGHSIAGTGSRIFDRPRQLPTPALSPAGMKYLDKRRSSVAGPVTGLGVVLGNRQPSPAEFIPSFPDRSPRTGGGVGEVKSIGRNGWPAELSARPDQRKNRVRKLSSAKMHELTSSPESTVLRSIPFDADSSRKMSLSAMPLLSLNDQEGPDHSEACVDGSDMGSEDGRTSTRQVSLSKSSKNIGLDDVPEYTGSDKNMASSSSAGEKQRTVSSSSRPTHRRQSSIGSKSELPSQNSTLRSKADRIPKRIDLDASKSGHMTAPMPDPHPSPIPQSIPLPPLSIPTYLQLELSSSRPSPLYIHHSATNDFPYESSRVKIERLQNFLLLPPQLEQVLWFGALACLDAWLFSFTILPLKFLKAIFILVQSWVINIGAEIQFVSGFIIKGVQRVWQRRQRRNSTLSIPAELRDADETSRSRAPSTTSTKQDSSALEKDSRTRTASGQHESSRRHHGSLSRKHRRNKSTPSALVADDKADILKGLLMIFTCTILMYFDASRMYHWIRGQAAIKLYVIYNVLEVADRLFSAIGQDVLECLFSRESLERKPDGRSKVMRPFWLFIIALTYTVIHSTALFYQVITLNVAVNSYSNALITLLLSNQFVEIKGTVFKKFEKENLFQLTCADVVERFQLWLMLTIIASRNIVETGGFSFGNTLSATLSSSIASASTNSTPVSTPPRSYSSILPKSFTLFPSSFFASFSGVNSILPSIGQVLGPFLVVLGSEMLVDWLKHAYINKFNNTRPAIYGRFLDVLAKDYYTNAFGDQNLTRRLGLPVIPLSCLFFRVSVQTYQMFLAAWLPQLPSTSTSSGTSLSSIHQHYSSTPPSPSSSSLPFLETITSVFPTSMNQITTFLSHITPPPPAISLPIFTVILLLLTFLTLLLFKLALGIVLLSFSRARYKRMKNRERDFFPHANGGPSQPSQPIHSPSLPSPTTPRQTSQPLKSPSFPTATSSGNDINNNSSVPPTTTNSNPPNPGSEHTVEGGRRVGGWGVVEVGDLKRRWIYADDPDGFKRLKERDEKASGRSGKSSGTKDTGIEGVMRYEMVAKRIW